ncbi:TonB-dependent receptor [Spirosoma telluris]|uniref:SusC/RagA family TonB-linked outer membrane protein n=1 Tax=Spirosoma telluris TaxID=2183553 RepID=UPI002FC2D04C
MMYSVRLFYASLLSSILAGGYPGLAQFVATAKAFPRTTHQLVSPQAVQLREVLNQFKVRYQVDILFEDRLVSDHIVNPESVDPAASLENNLTKVLKPQGLHYAKVKKGVYVVLANNKSKKQASTLELSILPPSAVATTSQPEMNQIGQLQAKALTVAVADQTITGRVTDGTTGGGLPGVSVVVKGTSRGTTTDSDGNYHVTVPDQNAGNALTLVYSFIGYATQEILVGNRTAVNVTLTSDDKTLNEIVVVGYGTQNRRELTGSVASLQTQSIKDQPVTNVVEGLTGRMPGVLVQQNTGAPGNAPSIKVRGLGSISAGNGPLIVVDGQPLNSGSTTNAGGLNQLNPNDIDKIDVLKDASATAIYGSRGSNGVIMITTKRGKSGQSRISFDYYTGTQQVSKKMDMLNAQQFAAFSKEAFNTAYLERVTGSSATDPNSVRQSGQRYRYPRGEFPGVNFDDPASLTSYDYQDMIFQKAPISNYQLSASGGSEKIQYFISGNYLKQDGIIKKSGIDRYTVRSNIDAQLSSKLKVGVSFSPTFMAENRVNSDGHWAGNGVINAALSLPPFIPIYQADGVTYNSQAFYAAPYDWPGITNPVANITEADNRVTQLRLLGNAYVELSIWKSLRYRGTIGGDLNYLRQNQYQTSAIVLNQLLPPNVSTGSAYTNQNINWVTNHTLSYTLDLGTTHHVDALVGLESQRNDFEESQVTANNFPNDIVRTVNAGTITGGTSTRNQWSLASYFARVTYSYKDRYLFNASVRSDGSSRFGATSRFGTFPSASIGWRLIEEPFMKAVPVISDLKLRASYGLSGNNAFTSNYPAIGVLSKDNYVLGNALANGLATSSIANPQLGWERSRQTDVGLDLGLFQNRIIFTMDYYKRITTDLLLQVQVPTLTGFSTAVRNIGQVENKGMEFALSTRNINGSGTGFTWTTDLNLSFNRNKVLALGPTGDAIRSGTGVGETNITVIGQPLGSFFGYQQLGIFQSQAELDAYPHFSDSRPGDVKFADVNGDGKLTADDRTLIGNNQPDFIYGITNSFSFKGIDLSIVAQGVQGGQILNLSRRFYENLEGNANELTTVLGRWHSAQDPGDGITPEPIPAVPAIITRCRLDGWRVQPISGFGTLRWATISRVRRFKKLKFNRYVSMRVYRMR